MKKVTDLGLMALMDIMFPLYFSGQNDIQQ